MTFPADYPIKPIHPSPVLTWSGGLLSAVRQLAIPCENVNEFVYDLLNGSGSTCGLPTSFPGFPFCFVDTINVQPLCAACLTSPEGAGVITDPTTELEGYPSGAAGSQDLTGCECVVTITYATRQVLSGQSGVREGTWITFERDVAGEYAKLPNRSMFWQEPGGLIGDPLLHDGEDGIRIPLADLTVTWHFVEEADMCFTEGNLLTMQGRVNANAYGAIFFPGSCTNIYPPETLLFQGYSSTVELSGKSIFGTYCTALERKRSLQLHFAYKEIHSFCTINGGPIVAGWNHAYDDRGRGHTGSNSNSASSPDIGPCIGWKRVVDQDGNTKYELISFANIFL